MNGRDDWRRLGSMSWVLSQVRDAVAHARDSRLDGEFPRLYRLVRPYTTCGTMRLRGLYWAVQHVVTRDIPGSLVECGTARGGSAALMALAAKQRGVARTLWVFDTFEGLPPPTDADPELAKAYTGSCRGSRDEVEALFDRLGVLGQSRLVKGLFQETLPACAVDRIAMLHIDGDWYESVKACLEHLYDRVTPGGVIQIDDYGHWEGARKAVDEFLRRRSIDVRLRWLDYTGRQLIKP